MSDFWIVVADDGNARLFFSDKIRVELNEIEVLTNPDARVHERDLNATAPGRSFDRGGPGRHAMQPPSYTRESHARRFARRIADRLEDGLRRNRYQRLILIAPPDFLGLLRREIPEDVVSRLNLDLPKDLVREKTPAVLEHIAAGRR